MGATAVGVMAEEARAVLKEVAVTVVAMAGAVTVAPVGAQAARAAATEAVEKVGVAKAVAVMGRGPLRLREMAA